MNKIWSYLQLPLAAIVIIAGIYGGFSISELKKQNSELLEQITKLDQKVAEFSEKTDTQFVQLNEKVETTNQKQKELQNAFYAAKKQGEDKIIAQQKQIDTLKSLIDSTKTVLSTSTPNTAKGGATEQETKAVASATATSTSSKSVSYVNVANKQATVIVNGKKYGVVVQNGDTAFSLLKRAGAENGFAVKYDSYSFGVMVTAIGSRSATGNQYWAFYYNGKYSNVGASGQKIKAGDTTSWKLETF